MIFFSYSYYYNSNSIWRTVSRQVDEVIPSDYPRLEASRVIQWNGLIHETWYCTPDQVTFIIICLLYTFFWHCFDFINCFGLWSRKIAGMFAITFCHLIFTSYNMKSRHHVFHLWFHAWNSLYITSPQKQVTDVSLILKDSDMDSENLSSLIRLSVSDGQKTDSSKVLSFIGI